MRAANLRGLVVLFVGGGLVLSIFDGFHTHSHTTSYPSPWMFQMAWWTPLLFGSVAAFGGQAYALLHPALGGPSATPARAKLAFGFAVFGALYFASGYLPASNAIKLVVLAIGAGALWWMLDRCRAGAALMLVAALCGSTTESLMVGAGAFRHLQPDVLGIPMWLPALYLAAAPAVGQTARAILND